MLIAHHIAFDQLRLALVPDEECALSYAPAVAHGASDKLLLKAENDQREVILLQEVIYVIRTADEGVRLVRPSPWVLNLDLAIMVLPTATAIPVKVARPHQRRSWHQEGLGFTDLAIVMSPFSAAELPQRKMLKGNAAIFAGESDRVL